MNGQVWIKDLVVLVADGQMEFAMRGLLTRGRSLGFREIATDFLVHPAKDPGCLGRGHEMLRTYHRQYAHALVMFDREGCGRSQSNREKLEEETEKRLSASGWEDRSATIVLDPELEIWVWSDYSEVDAVLGWSGRNPCLTAWLVSQGHLALGETKPKDPKRAMDEALRATGKRRSSAIFQQLAQRVSVHRCVDPAFLKLKTTLSTWFGHT